jgi:hypothetical protein
MQAEKVLSNVRVRHKASRHTEYNTTTGPSIGHECTSSSQRTAYRQEQLRGNSLNKQPSRNARITISLPSPITIECIRNNNKIL